VAKQSGVKLSKIIELTKVDPLLDKSAIAAYDTPNYSSDEYSKMQAIRFENNIYLTCIKNIGKGR